MLALPSLSLLFLPFLLLSSSLPAHSINPPSDALTAVLTNIKYTLTGRDFPDETWSHAQTKPSPRVTPATAPNAHSPRPHWNRGDDTSPPVTVRIPGRDAHPTERPVVRQILAEFDRPESLLSLVQGRKADGSRGKDVWEKFRGRGDEPLKFAGGRGGRVRKRGGAREGKGKGRELLREMEELLRARGYGKDDLEEALRALGSV